MTVTAKCLVETKYAENAQTTEYTVTANFAIIDKCVAYNGTAGAVTLAINVVPSGGSAGASNLVVNKTLNAGETYTFPEIVGNVLNKGDFISLITGAASSVTFRLSGREIT
jgi:hypothetical protein